MGIILLCLLSYLSVSDIITIISIVVNGILALWIVKVIQASFANRRTLKDHFISEVKDLRVEYRTVLNNIYAKKLNSKEVIPWFKVMNIKVNDLMDCLNREFNVEKFALDPYQNQLRDLITESEDFIEGYKGNKKLILSASLIEKMTDFHGENQKLFNDLIIKINNS